MKGGSLIKKQFEENVREIVFGLEDSLVSTLGAVTGIAAGTGDPFVVILSGIVLIFVESVSMSAGSYLSSKAAAEVKKKKISSSHTKVAARAGVVMGVFYLAGGVFPLIPYFFLPVFTAIIPSILLTGVVLFILGAVKAHFLSLSWVKSGLEMVIVSLSAALLGFLIGRVVAMIFGITV